MKVRMFVFLLAALGLGACSDSLEIDSSPPKKNLKSSPQIQEIVSSSMAEPDTVSVVLHNHAGGDLVYYFTYKPTQNGILYFSFPFLLYNNCALENLIDIYTFQRVVEGAAVDEEPLNYMNRHQKIYQGSEYRLKVELIALGKCEFLTLWMGVGFDPLSVAQPAIYEFSTVRGNK